MHDTGGGSVNPDRPLSQLLMEHVQAMREVEQTLPPQQQTHIDTSQIKTEQEASAYIEQVMSRLLPATRALGGR